MIERKPPFWNSRGVGTVGTVIIVLLVLIVAAGIGALIGYYTSDFTCAIREVFEPPFDGKQVVYILALGEDDTSRTDSKPRGLCDTIILTRVDFENERVAALSIPRDTRVDLDAYGYGACKINAAHVYGGPVLAELAAAELVGVKPDYYIKANIKGFKKSVDIVGGVEIDVEKNMRYTDRWGGLYINLKKGRQLLDGDKAAQYVRFRHDALGDLARVERQQKFLKEFAKKAFSPTNLPKLPRIVDALLENVETDLGPGDALYLAKFMREIGLDQVKTAVLPGVPEDIGGISYWVADAQQSADIVRDLFFPRPALPKVEVLNGGGMPGAAQRVAETLEQYGYEVTVVGNADSFDCASTEVISHNSDAEGVARIASIVNSSTVKYKQEPSAKADVTVIVGRDYAFANSGI